METLGLTSEVLAGGKRFQIQTKYSLPTEKIVSNILDDGKIITKKEVQLDANVPVEQIKEKLDSVHREMVSDMELWFYIADKVRTINHPISNNKLGLVFLKKNLIEEAIEEFKIAIEKEPDFVEAYNNLGRAYLLDENYSAAIDAFQKGIEKNPSYADLRNNLGYSYFELGEYKNALNEFQEALRLNPQYSEAHFNLAQVFVKILYEELKEPELPELSICKEQALKHLQQASEYDTSITNRHLANALAHLEKDEVGEAMEELERAQAQSTDKFDMDFENEFYLKFMFGGKGKDDKFITQYTEELLAAIDQYPNYADLRNNLGIVYLIQCRNLFLKALDEFRQALKINPSFKKAEKNLKLAENDGKGFLILLRAILK